MIVRFTDEAIEDLASIRTYLAEQSPKAADRLGRRLFEAAGDLDKFANKGKSGLVEGTREITTVWPFVIVYRVTPAEVQILRVWRGAQDRAES